MRQTKKYTKACELLTFPHETQERLYRELNRLGWWWESKKQLWERNDSLQADEATDLIRVRVWTDTEKIEVYAEVIVESLEAEGLKLQERSEAYVCRPPKQNESRIYLTFTDENK